MKKEEEERRRGREDGEVKGGRGEGDERRGEGERRGGEGPHISRDPPWKQAYTELTSVTICNLGKDPSEHQNSKNKNKKRMEGGRERMSEVHYVKETLDFTKKNAKSFQTKMVVVLTKRKLR